MWSELKLSFERVIQNNHGSKQQLIRVPLVPLVPQVKVNARKQMWVGKSETCLFGLPYWFSWMTLVEWLYSTSLASFCLSVIRNPSQCPAIDNYSFITYYFSLCHLSLWIWLYHYIVKNTWIAIKTQLLLLLLKEEKKARIAKFPSKVVARTPVITVWTNAMFCKVCQKTGKKNAFSAEKGCTNFQTLMPTRHISGQDRKNAVGGDTMHGNMKCSVERTFSGTRLSYHCRFLGCILACKR